MEDFCTSILSTMLRQLSRLGDGEEYQRLYKTIELFLAHMDGFMPDLSRALVLSRVVACSSSDGIMFLRSIQESLVERRAAF